MVVLKMKIDSVKVREIQFQPATTNLKNPIKTSRTASYLLDILI